MDKTSKTIIIGMILILVLVLGFGAYVVNSKVRNNREIAEIEKRRPIEIKEPITTNSVVITPAPKTYTVTMPQDTAEATIVFTNTPFSLVISFKTNTIHSYFASTTNSENKVIGRFINGRIERMMNIETFDYQKFSTFITTNTQPVLNGVFYSSFSLITE